MRRATAFAALALVSIALAGLALLASSAHAVLAPGGSSAAPVAASSLACSVKASCGAGEVAVFRLSSTSNAHAGTFGGSSYGNVVCCGGVHNLSASCSAVYAVTLSGADNAHVAADGSYASLACLSVPYGVADCTYGPTCAADYQCVATVSGSANAHLADCDGVGDYATKLCCYVEDDNDNDSLLDPPDPDDDNDQFGDLVEGYLATDPWDACPNNPSHDAWPLDIDMSRDIDVTGDVFNYAGRIGAVGGHASDPSCPPDAPKWWQRLDLEPDCTIDVTGDVWKYAGKIGTSCT